MPPTISIHLLGGLRLSVDGNSIALTDTNRLASLLAYLVLHREKPLPRAQLAFLLWPESTESQAYTNLRNLVFKLRQLLPSADTFLHTTRHTLHWAAQDHWQLDVQLFLDALRSSEQSNEPASRRQALERAIALYQGDLLPTCYDDWLLPERDTLRERFLQALKSLSNLLEQRHEYEAAIAVAWKLLHLDPLDESMYRHIMNLYLRTGNRSAALRTFHTCASQLERELGVEPEAETRAIYEHLLDGPAMSTDGIGPATGMLHTKHTSPAPLIGRQQAWTELQSAWQHVLEATGESSLVIISGEAGIGKSRLAEAMRLWVQQQNMSVATAHCYTAEQTIAYTPIISWLKQDVLKKSLDTLPDLWLTDLVRLLPDLLLRYPHLHHQEPVQEGWQQLRLFEALVQVLLHTRQPLLLVLDDLQWTDSDTLTWLHYALRNKNTDLRLLLVCTLRAEEITAEHPFHTWLASLRREIPITHIALERLDLEETAQLASSLVTQPWSQHMYHSLYQETEGNPLFIVETVRARTLNGVYETSPSSLPPTVQAVLATRLAQLSTSASELVDLASVIGRSFPFQVLVQASDYSEDSVVQGLDELWQRRIIYEQGNDAYDFSHDKLRETAYLALSAPRRRHLHQHVAEALLRLHAIRLDTVGGQIAFHYERAGLIEKALFYYEQASVAALHMYANIEASTVLRHAIELHQAMPQPQVTEIARLYERLGDIFHLTGQSDACLDMFYKAIALLSPADTRWLARLYRKIASHWNSVTRPADGIASYQEAARLLDLVPQEERDMAWQQEWLQMQFDQLWTLSLLNRAHEMDAILTLIQQPVSEIGTLIQQAYYFQCLCLRDTRLMRYRVNEPVIEAARTALALSQKTDRAGDIGNFMYTLGCMLMWAGQFTKAAEQLQAALALEEQVGDITLQLFGLFLLSMLYRRQKQPDEVRQCAERLLHGPYPGYQPMAYASQAWLAWRENHWQQAQQLAEHALATWQRTLGSYPFQWTALWPLLAISLQQNRPSDSIEYVRQLLDPVQEAYSTPLSSLLESALQSWQNDQPEQTHHQLCEAVVRAQQEGYL